MATLSVIYTLSSAKSKMTSGSTSFMIEGIFKNLTRIMKHYSVKRYFRENDPLNQHDCLPFVA